MQTSDPGLSWDIVGDPEKPLERLDTADTSFGQERSDTFVTPLKDSREQGYLATEMVKDAGIGYTDFLADGAEGSCTVTGLGEN